jgi:hypothetical protein
MPIVLAFVAEHNKLDQLIHIKALVQKLQTANVCPSSNTTIMSWIRIARDSSKEASASSALSASSASSASTASSSATSASSDSFPDNASDDDDAEVVNVKKNLVSGAPAVWPRHTHPKRKAKVIREDDNGDAGAADDENGHSGKRQKTETQTPQP